MRCTKGKIFFFLINILFKGNVKQKCEKTTWKQNVQVLIIFWMLGIPMLNPLKPN
jgi:hypothetical protein